MKFFKKKNLKYSDSQNLKKIYVILAQINYLTATNKNCNLFQNSMNLSILIQR